LQLRQYRARIILQRLGDIHTVVVTLQYAGATVGDHQLNGLARNAEADGDFRAVGLKTEVAGQFISNKTGALVAPVKAHSLAQKALADTDGDFTIAGHRLPANKPILPVPIFATSSGLDHSFPTRLVSKISEF